MKKNSILLLMFMMSILAHAQLEKAEYSIKNLAVNTAQNDQGASFWGQGRVVFASDKDKAGLGAYSAYIDDNYELKYPKKVEMGFSNQFNQASFSFSPDLKYVYFTVSSSSNSNKVKIYRAQASKTGQWSNAVELPFNSNSFNCAHPSVSDDGSRLYFSSDMPGGYGGMDIYFVQINSGNTYGTPQNLGGVINSSAQETYPDVNQGLLYFSSNKSGGLGGLDVYMVPIGNLFMEPQNLGTPINSSSDDFGFTINGGYRKGYLSSNRPQGQGGIDIYSFVQETAIKNCTQNIDVVVLDFETGQVVEEAEVNLFDDKGKWINRFETDKYGMLSIKANKCDKDYKLKATKDKYTEDEVDVYYMPDKESQTIKMLIFKDPAAIAEAEAIADSGIPDDQMFVKVDNIDFLLNRYNIPKKGIQELDKVVKFMEEHPTVIVEFSSHTDSRGPDDFNMQLTKLRAQEVVSYIVGKGIDYRRIYGKGYGESMPLNHCVNGVECTDKEYAENRRTEFFIVAK